MLGVGKTLDGMDVASCLEVEMDKESLVGSRERDILYPCALIYA
jgi:hypothetical protein